MKRTMSPTGWAMAMIASCVVGCGAAQPPAEPRLGALPELPFPLADGPRELRTAWSRAEALLAEPVPQPPAAGFETMDEAGTWANEAVLPWAHHHLEHMSDVTDPLAGAVALDGTLRVFAASIAAHLYERLLDVLVRIPVPREIASDPELVSAYRESFAAALGAALEDTHALLAECITAAAARTDADAWGADCALRSDAMTPIE